MRSWGIGDSVPTISGGEVAIITAYSGDVECKSTSKEAFNVMSSASGLVNQNIASEETYIIKNNSNAGIDLKLDVNAVYDYAKYNEKYAVTDFGYSKISLSQYINKSATIAVTNKNEEAVTVYYLSDNASLVSVQKSESPALIKVELESGKSWYFENTGDKGTRIITQHDVKWPYYLNLNWGAYVKYDDNNKVVDFRYSSCETAYLDAGYKETNY